MADIKISELGSMIAVSDSDVLPIVNSASPAATNKVTAALIKKYAIGDTNISGLGDGSVTGAISALDSGKADKAMVSQYTETIGSTALGSYTSGQTFAASNGKYYKATAPITAGATVLTVGTNCAQTTVSSEIQALTNNVSTNTSNITSLQSNKADKVLVITLPNVSTSKLSFTSSDVAAIANVTADHVVVESVLSNPSAQLSDWTITTASNSIIVSGTVASGVTTNLTLTLIQKA